MALAVRVPVVGRTGLQPRCMCHIILHPLRDVDLSLFAPHRAPSFAFHGRAISTDRVVVRGGCLRRAFPGATKPLLQLPGRRILFKIP